MLTRDDLQAISELINTAVSASEGRMMDALRQETNSLRQEMNARMDKMDARMDKLDSRMDKMDAQMNKMDSRMDKTDSRMDRIEGLLAAIKEDTEITRGATNALVEWAEQVGMLVNAPFPMLHNTAIEP